jgi:hypothetical protein
VKLAAFCGQFVEHPAGGAGETPALPGSVLFSSFFYLQSITVAFGIKTYGNVFCGSGCRRVAYGGKFWKNWLKMRLFS